MINDPAAVRAALEPHGYGARHVPAKPTNWTPEEHWLAKCGGGNCLGAGGIGGVYTYETEDDALHDSLGAFLNDKAQTGARIKAFPEATPLGYDWEPIICADDPDEAIAALWLQVKGLTDPRGGA